jgi:hypothetical protein
MTGALLAGICCLLSRDVSAAPNSQPAQRADGAAIVGGAGRSKPDGARDWRETATGDILGSGVSVQAAPGEPLEMLLPDGVSVTLEAGGAARWLAPGKLPTETNRWTRGYHLVLVEGELDVRMPPGPKGAHAFLVSTKAGTLTDWRGKLHVSSHEETTAAAIYEGALVVGSNGQGFAVYDGAGILMRKGVDPDKSRVIPKAPTWDPRTGPIPSFVAVPEGARATVGFAWEPVAGVTSYRVAIANDPEMTQVFQRATTADTSFGVVQAEAAGAANPAWAQVRAVGTEGIVGEWSAPRPLRVVRYHLPEGAFVARDGALVLPAKASIALDSGADEIEAAYENVRSMASRVAGVPLYWARLSGPLRIPDETPMRIVHLRDASLGREAETQLVLARRQLRADVDLRPKDARSGDPVDARVLVWDPSGRIDPMGEPVALEAMLDLDPLPVAWQRTGNIWMAHLRAKRTAYPSVIRVVVKDGLGTEIGRGFVEVAGPTAER